MTPLLHFALSALLVSTVARAAVFFAINAPPRFKFWMAMLGLAAWLVPWPWISAPKGFIAPPSIAGWVDESMQVVRTQSALPTPAAAANEAATDSSMFWLWLMVPGLIWFTHEYRIHRRTLRVWGSKSHDGSRLLRLLPASSGRLRPSVRIVEDSEIAAASGLFKPTLWLGAALGDEALRAALVHEYCHARSRDPLWLLLIQLTKRAYCWNPIVGSLARQAQLWLEADCDRRCALMLGRRNYSVALARLLLSGGPHLRGAAAISGTRNESVRRLELLQRPVRAGWRECAGLALCAATALGSVGYAAPPLDPRIGRWAEVGEWAPAEDPILRSFEDLGGGFTRFRDDVTHDGTAAFWTEHRCDGRSYTLRDRSGMPTEWTQSCELLDDRTVQVSVSGAGNAQPIWRAVDRVSRDGETYTSTVTSSVLDGTEAPGITRVFWRLH